MRAGQFEFNGLFKIFNQNASANFKRDFTPNRTD